VGRKEDKPLRCSKKSLEVSSKEKSGKIIRGTSETGTSWGQPDGDLMLGEEDRSQTKGRESRKNNFSRFQVKSESTKTPCRNEEGERPLPPTRSPRTRKKSATEVVRKRKES